MVDVMVNKFVKPTEYDENRHLDVFVSVPYFAGLSTLLLEHGKTSGTTLFY